MNITAMLVVLQLMVSLLVAAQTGTPEQKQMAIDTSNRVLVLVSNELKNQQAVPQIVAPQIAVQQTATTSQAMGAVIPDVVIPKPKVNLVIVGTPTLSGGGLGFQLQDENGNPIKKENSSTNELPKLDKVWSNATYQTFLEFGGVYPTYAIGLRRSADNDSIDQSIATSSILHVIFQGTEYTAPIIFR